MDHQLARNVLPDVAGAGRRRVLSAGIASTGLDVFRRAVVSASRWHGSSRRSPRPASRRSRAPIGFHDFRLVLSEGFVNQRASVAPRAAACPSSRRCGCAPATARWFRASAWGAGVGEHQAVEQRALLERDDLADHAAHGQADEVRARDLKFSIVRTNPRQQLQRVRPAGARCRLWPRVS